MKPQGRSIARSSSCQPAMPCSPACRNVAGDGTPPAHRSARRGRPAAPRSPSDVGHLARRWPRKARRAARSSSAVSAVRAATRRAELLDVLLAHAGEQVAVVLAGGARPTPHAAPARGRAAARRRPASAGPPPDQPSVTNSPSPRWSRIAATSAASSATVRGRGAVGPPGRAAVPGPRVGDHAQPALGGGRSQHPGRARRPAGVPWWKTRGNRPRGRRPAPRGCGRRGWARAASWPSSASR